MTAPTGSVFGQIDGILANASGFQTVTDNQATIVQTLASVIEDLAPSFQGMQGLALQQAGQNLHNAGMQIQTAFGFQAHAMANNAYLLADKDAHNANIIQQVLNMG